MIERGECDLSDETLAQLVEAYGFGDANWARSAELQLVFDRSSGFDVGTQQRSSLTFWVEPSSSDAHRRLLATRFLAVSMMVGLDLSARSFGIGTFADAAEISADAALDLLLDVLTVDGAAVGSMIETLRTRTVVPSVGVLIGETPGGSLVLAPSPEATGHTVAAAGECELLLSPELTTISVPGDDR